MTESALTIREEDYLPPVRQPAEAPQAMTPMIMLSQAVERGASMEMLEKLMGLQERWEANQARKAFDAALAAAKAEIPVITKNRRVGFETKGGGETNYQHEDLGEIARTIDPILAKHGLSYRFRTVSEVNQPVSVTCVVAHRDGHSETNTLTAGRDDSGKKNLIQQIGSTITYLQRYTLKAALGLAASADDDGRKSEPVDLITEEQIMELRDLLEATGSDIPRFKAYMKVEDLADIRADRFDAAVKLLKQKEQRK